MSMYNMENSTDSRPCMQDLVLIGVDSEELMRRISCLIERKREELNAYNNREFLDESLYKDPEGEVCARTAAVYIKREGSKSHISASRVCNRSGPQIAAGQGAEASRPNRDSAADFGLDERLTNLESVLNVRLTPGERKEMTKRVKAVEDRVQFLMGVSPEYFSMHCLQSKPRAQPLHPFPSTWNEGFSPVEFRQDMTSEELDVKIAHLKELLARERLQHRK